MRKISILVASLAFVICSFSAYAGDCGVSACGGGNDKCCKDENGNLFYMTIEEQ
jgi:hypothetical protein